MPLKTHSSPRPKGDPSRGQTPKGVRRALIFAHWDVHGLVDDHIIYALEQYRPFFKTVIFVSPNYRRKSRRLEELCDDIIVRENTGYDFGSWKAGLQVLNLSNYEEVIFSNDSIYGPFQALDTIFSRNEVTAADIWGMTISEEHQVRHLQTYFFAMKKKTLLSEAGKRFWEDVGPVCHQREIVEQFEMLLLQEFEKEGFSVKSFFDGQINPDIPWREKVSNLIRGPKRFKSIRRYLDACSHRPYNPTHLQWRQCVDAGVPFIKVDLFRDNPNELRIGPIKQWIRTKSRYPINLIKRHQGRLKRAFQVR